MTRRRTIKGILHNFLGTYTSRYSDYDGYWLFGVMDAEIDGLKMDLLHPCDVNLVMAHVSFAIQLAARKFHEQLSKAGINTSWMREAWLEITKLPGVKRDAVNGITCDGHHVRFVVKVISNLNKTYENQVVIFVAPHNPAIEMRSIQRLS